MTHKRLDIQALRAIAVAGVIAFHCGLPVPGGFTGVDLFFVISGYVITSALVREWTRNGAIHLARFYFRRFKRLAPALSLVIVTTVFFAAFLQPPLRSHILVTAMTGAGAVLLAANAVIAVETGGYFQAAATENPFLHTWSLSVEEQFYIVFPALLVAGLILGRRIKWSKTPLTIIGALGLVSIAILGLHVYASLPTKIDLAIGFFSPLARAWEFAAGAILSFVKPPNRRWAQILAACGLLLLAASFWLISSATVFPGIATLMPVLGASALIAAGSVQGTLIPRMLSIKPIVAVGDASYSLYLWHWPAIVFAAILYGKTPQILTAAAILSFIPATLSYRFVETPLRVYEPKSRIRKFSLIVRWSVPTLLACGILATAYQNGFWTPQIRNFQAAVDPEHAGVRHGCGYGYVPRPNDQSCSFGPESSAGPIYVVGDSNADHLSEAAISAGEQTHRPVQIFTKGGCSFIGKFWAGLSEGEQRECRKYVDGALSFLDNAKPGLVVIGISDSTWNGGAVGEDQASQTNDREKKNTVLEQDLIASVRRIQHGGHQVLLVQPVPKYLLQNGTELFDFTRCSTFRIWLGRCPAPASLPLATVEREQIWARQGLASAAQATHSDLLDLTQPFCSDKRCSDVSKTGALLYRDPGHLSIQGSKMIAPYLVHWVEHFDS